MRPTLKLADEQAEDTLRLEVAAERAVERSLLPRVNEARRAITASYVQEFGDADAPASPGPGLTKLLAGAKAALRQAVEGEGDAVAEVIRDYAQQGAQLGAEHAAAIMEEADPLSDAPRAKNVRASDAKQAIAGGLSGGLAGLSVAVVATGGLTAAVAAVGSVTKGVNRAKAIARTEVNSQHSAGVRAVSEKYAEGRIWVAERDGCVHCLAYAGQIAWNGESFPTGRTFGEKPLGWADELPDPPLHPNCRCETVPHRKEFGTSFSEALEREARRSVAKGWRVESESEAVRLRAAESLLRRGADLPASVQDQARRAVQEGSFRGRIVPRFVP